MKINNKIVFNYHFEVEEDSDVFDLGLTIRGIPNQVFNASFEKLKSKQNFKGDIDSIEQFKVPSEFFKGIMASISSDFKRLRRMIQNKNDITWANWNVTQAFFKRNSVDEWVCVVIIRGDIVRC